MNIEGNWQTRRGISLGRLFQDVVVAQQTVKVLGFLEIKLRCLDLNKQKTIGSNWRS